MTVYEVFQGYKQPIFVGVTKLYLFLTCEFY